MAEPPLTVSAVKTSPDRVTAVSSGWPAIKCAASSRSFDDGDARQQPGQRQPGGGARRPGRRDQVGGPPGALGKLGTGVRRRGRGARQQQGRAAGVVVFQPLHGGGRGPGVLHHDGVGGGAEGRRDGGLEAWFNSDHGRQGTEDPGNSRAKDVVRAVLPVQSKLEGVAAGNEGAAFPFALTFGRLQRVDLGKDCVEPALASS